ncbi:MAG: cation:proton antiporter [Spirochaetes bacterium]|nr:cation:proton antiporter [Spirochaetota bacterium]
MEHELIIRSVIVTLVAGSLSIVLADRFRFPAIIFYFFAGISLGPYGLGLIRPASLGNGLNILITIFVGIILFEGGLSLNISRLKTIRHYLTRHILLTIAITMSLSWLAARYIAGLPPEIALVFASLTIVTGPTVTKPILRHLSIRRNVKTFLNGEAVIIDAMGAVLAIAVIEYFVSQELLGISILGFLLSIIIGVGVGVVSGLSVKFLLTKRLLFPVHSRSIFTLGMVFFVFYISETLSSESGLMSVAVFGIVLSTIDYKDKEKLLSFKEQITQIVISFLFILLSAHFNITKLSEQILAGMLVVAVIIAARFPAAFISTIGGTFSLRERLFIGWLGPRGIIAISVASIAVIKLKSAGMKNTEILEILIFMLISVTVLLQGMSAGFVARRLRILVEGDRSIIILGINPTTLGMAQRWQKYQNDVLFVDSNLSKCMIAQKEGFSYIHGNGLAPDTLSGIEVDNYTSALASTPNNEVNVLFCRFIKETYGVSKLYVILAEKAGEELAGIIESEGIKTACIGIQKDRAASFFSVIKEYFSVKKPTIREITVSSETFIQNKPGEYPVPENIFILFVVRNGNNCYVYNDSLKLQKNDILHVIINDEAALQQLDVFTQA